MRKKFYFKYNEYQPPQDMELDGLNVTITFPADIWVEDTQLSTITSEYDSILEKLDQIQETIDDNSRKINSLLEEFKNSKNQ